jgi:hypothetical protein
MDWPARGEAEGPWLTLTLLLLMRSFTIAGRREQRLRSSMFGCGDKHGTWLIPVFGSRQKGGKQRSYTSTERVPTEDHAIVGKFLEGSSRRCHYASSTSLQQTPGGSMHAFVNLPSASHPVEVVIVARHIREDVLETPGTSQGQYHRFGIVVEGQKMDQWKAFSGLARGVGTARGIDK